MQSLCVTPTLTIHAIYTWAHPILVEARAEVLTRAQELEVEWTTRYVHLFLLKLSLLTLFSLKARVEFTVRELITAIIEGDTARTKGAAGCIILIAGEVVVHHIATHLLERARGAIAA